MKTLPLNTYKERKKCWQEINARVQPDELEKGLSSLHPDTALVLRLHYQQEYSLQEIVPLLGRSISIVRNHHNRGIFQLQQYFLSEKKQAAFNNDHSV